MRRALSVIAILSFTAVAPAQGTPKSGPPMPSDFANWKTVQVGAGIFAFIAPDGVTPLVSGNSVAIIGDSSVLVVDAGQFPSVARAQIAAIKKLTDKPVRFVVNTHWHPDHWLGNTEYAAAFPGVAFISTRNTADLARTKAMPFISTKYAQDIVDRLGGMLASGKHVDSTPFTPMERQYYEYAMPQFKEYLTELQTVKPVLPSVLFTDTLTVLLGTREVRVMFLGRANTGGDAVVYVPDAKVLMTGDIVVSPYPYGIGSFIGEWIDVLRKLEAIDATAIVPGHGAVQHDARYLDLLVRLLSAVRAQTQAAAAKGLTLAETRKQMQLDEFQKELCGSDSWCLFGYQGVFVQPAVGRAYREAKEGKLKDEN
jgi:glyoxylase-like metal-dependent hydrolase (beta-lactamase superfamily II)